jgi:hypothetical protein
MTDIPKKLEDWKLMEPKRLPTLWSEVGQVTVGESEWTMGRSEQALALYLFTDLPHPDDPDHTCIFVMDASQPFRRLCDALIPDEENA